MDDPSPMQRRGRTRQLDRNRHAVGEADWRRPIQALLERVAGIVRHYRVEAALALGPRVQHLADPRATHAAGDPGLAHEGLPVDRLGGHRLLGELEHHVDTRGAVDRLEHAAVAAVAQDPVELEPVHDGSGVRCR